MRAPAVLLLAGACNFSTHAAPTDATDAPVIDSVDAADAPIDSSGSGSGSAVLGRRKPITIDKTKVAGAVDDFPVWIDITDRDLMAARVDGHDIFFTDANGVALDYERTSFDRAMHHLQAWVRVPHLDSMMTVTIYVVYGDVSLAPGQNPAGVFRNGFAAVWHLDDTLADTAIADATGTHTGTAVGFNPSQQVAAQLGGGFSFDGTSRSMVTFTNPLLGNTPHTISAWVDSEHDVGAQRDRLRWARTSQPRRASSTGTSSTPARSASASTTMTGLRAATIYAARAGRSSTGCTRARTRRCTCSSMAPRSAARRTR